MGIFGVVCIKALNCHFLRAFSSTEFCTCWESRPHADAVSLLEVSCLFPLSLALPLVLAPSCSLTLDHTLFLPPPPSPAVCASTGGEPELSFLVWLLGYLSSGPISEAQILFIDSVYENFFGSLQHDFFYLVIEQKKMSYLHSHHCIK